MKAIPSLLLVALMATPFPAFAQQAIPAPQAAQPKEPDPDPAMLRAMKSKVFEVKHRDPVALYRSLRTLGSGVKGSNLDFNSDRGINTLTVRDFPENLAAIEEAIKRLDVAGAEPSTSDVEFQLHVLFAGASAGVDNPLPEELQSVVKTLKQTLAYRHYALGASFVQRARILEYNRSETDGLGYVLPQFLLPSDGKEAPRLRVKWRIKGLSLDRRSDGAFSVGIGSFGLDLVQESETKTVTLAAFSSPLTLKEGERVVVGTSVIKDRGLIVVLSARRVN